MKTTPDISFLIPVYNMADTLPETLQSLSRAREFPFEVIVINDGSTDLVEVVIETWENKFSQISTICFHAIHQENRGRADALNRGAEIAKGEYLSFVDADDVIDPVELPKLLGCAADRILDFAIGQFKLVNESGNLVINRPLDPDLGKEDLIRKIAYSPLSPITLNAFLIRREFFFQVGGLDSLNLKSEDKDLVIRLLRSNGEFRICGSFHYVYKKHDLSRQKIVLKRIQWMKYRQKMISKNFSSARKYVSKFLQFNYDLAKLFYELMTKYKVR